MMLRRSYLFIAVFAAIAIVLTSFASAGRMVASDHNTPQLQAYLAAGGSLDDLCIDGDIGHDAHECPFCLLLSDPAGPGTDPVSWTLFTQARDLRAHDLIQGPQFHGGALPARGPPAVV